MEDQLKPSKTSQLGFSWIFFFSREVQLKDKSIMLDLLLKVAFNWSWAKGVFAKVVWKHALFFNINKATVYIIIILPWNISFRIILKLASVSFPRFP